VLVNAAWQNGAAPVARVVALAARIAAVLLVPVTLLVIYALMLRVRDHGWTEDRVIAAACMLVAACYAGGYAAAALRRGWLRGVAGVNIAAAFVVLGVLLALFTPLADPARLAVNDQVARLESGRVPVAKFDVGYLRFEGARYGPEALARLERTYKGAAAPQLKAQIAAVRKLHYPAGSLFAEPAVLAVNLRPMPVGTRLPASFMAMDWSAAPAAGIPGCLLRRGVACDAYVLDLGGDARPEVLLLGEKAWETAVAAEDTCGKWRIVGNVPILLASCARFKAAMREGKLRVLPAAWNDLEVDGHRFPISEPRPPLPDCAPAKTAQPDAARR
ncbi:MAG: DUF4153 domain-containing protein, partial [Telluria sp.]